MMVRFDGEDLFGSGAHRLEIGGRALRHVEHDGPGSDGVRVIGQGRGGRRIVQIGELLADNTAKMRGLMERIEAKLDGLAHELVDGDGEVWSGLVMLKFEPEASQRVGTRVRVGYRIQYVGS